MSKSITIKPKRAYGIRTEISGNINFMSKEEILYPLAGVLCIEEYETFKQKFLRFPDNSQLENIVLSPSRKYMAIAEKNGDDYVINVYDTALLKKRKSILLPKENPVTQAGQMSFTFDNKFLMVLSKEPIAHLNMFTLEKSTAYTNSRASNPSVKSNTTMVSCNPADNTICAVAGDYCLKILQKTDKGFQLLGSVTGETIVVTSLVWLAGDILLVGTNEAELHVIEAGDFKNKFPAETTILLDIGKDLESMEQLPVASHDSVYEQEKKVLDVMCLTNFGKGFAFAIFNIVYIYHKETLSRYRKKIEIVLPTNMYPSNLFKITQMTFNPPKDTIMVTALHPQIYLCKFEYSEDIKSEMQELQFQPFGEYLHIDEIIDIAMCPWKPIIMSCSKDKTIRIWNYKTLKIELIKHYQNNIKSVALHPTGILMAAGFVGSMKVMQIQLDDLKEVKSYPFLNCTVLGFSNKGHFLACGNENLVIIICVFTFETLWTFKGHNQTVLSFMWSVDDRYLVSAGLEGSVYQWSMDKGVKMLDFVKKGTEHRSLVLRNDMSSIYSVTQTGYIREIGVESMEIGKEIKTPNLYPLTSIVMARTEMFMFASTERGQLYNVQVPFSESAGGTCVNFRFFNTAIVKLQMSFDDCTLITASADGTLVVWSILNIEGKTSIVDSDMGICNDITISRLGLINYLETIDSLEHRLKSQTAEFTYKMEQTLIMHYDQVQSIHKEYRTAIEEINQMNEETESQNVEDMNVMKARLSHTIEEHQKATLELEAQLQEKVLTENAKMNDMRNKKNEMQIMYETRLRRASDHLQSTIINLENDFKVQLAEKDNVIDNLVKEIEDKKVDFAEYCKEVEISNDKNTIEMKLFYENKIKNIEEKSMKWRAEINMIEKRYNKLIEEHDLLLKDMDNLQYKYETSEHTIKKLRREIEDLKYEVSERDATILDKEKKFNELQKKNQELEKYKQVLSHKINELKAQIEPKDREIKEKKDQITEMKKELESFQKTCQDQEFQIACQKDKFHGIEMQLLIEKNKNRTARAQISRVCGDIYYLSRLIQCPDKLKECVVTLFHRYGDDKDLKKTLKLDEDVKNEFTRQREQLERIADNKAGSECVNTDSGDFPKLLRENTQLITELNNLRQQLNDSQKHRGQMESILGLSKKFMPTKLAREKLDKAVANIEELQENFRKEYTKLENTIKTLTNENNNLRLQVVECNKRVS